MAKQELQNVEVTLPNGRKTTFRVSPDKAEQYRKMSQQSQQQQQQSQSKERQPRQHTGDVATK